MSACFCPPGDAAAAHSGPTAPPVHLVPHVVGGAASSSSAGGPPPAVMPVVAPCLDIVPLPEEERRRLRSRVHGFEGEPWHRLTVPDGWGWLVVDPFSNSLGAHCGNKSHKNCKINRVFSKRPIGYLVAWLLNCRKTATAEEHKRLKLDRIPDGPLSHAKRLQARLWIQAHPAAAHIMELEADPTDGNDEPLVL